VTVYSDRLRGNDMKRAVRQFLGRVRFEVARQLRPRVQGRLQPYRYTLPNRYPWMFEFACSRLRDVSTPRLLSFGCSTGDELVSLRSAFPEAIIRGLDIAPAAIAACRTRLASDDRISVAVACDARGEEKDSFGAVFCLAVLCHGDLTATGATRSDRLFPFSRFEEAVADLARCVRPGGHLFIQSANFRFSETATASKFDVVLLASKEQAAVDLLYDCNNCLVVGEPYYPVGFCKRAS